MEPKDELLKNAKDLFQKYVETLNVHIDNAAVSTVYLGDEANSYLVYLLTIESNTTFMLGSIEEKWSTSIEGKRFQSLEIHPFFKHPDLVIPKVRFDDFSEAVQFLVKLFMETL